MSLLACPRCGWVDQVQSVRAVYDSQTSRHVGHTRGMRSGIAYAPGVGLIPAVGSSSSYTTVNVSSLLAQYVAPPPAPSLAHRGGGCLTAALPFVALVFLFPFLIINGTGADDMRGAGLLFSVFPAVCVLIVWMLVLRERCRTRKRDDCAYRAYAAEYPTLFEVWNEALLCHRCHVGYLPDGSAPVAVEQFQAMVLAIGQYRLEHGKTR